MDLTELQRLMKTTYGTRDRVRGVDANFRWFAEEVGELAQAIRRGDPDAVASEFSDVAAWLASLANLLDVDLDAAVERYRDGCPKCHRSPCECPS